MATKKKSEDQDQIPLSETQNTSLTGRDAEPLEMIGRPKIVALSLARIERAAEKAQEENLYSIKEAALKEGLCRYAYEITSGVNLGDVHAVKGGGLYKPTLMDAFAKLNVHLACVDDSFKLKGVDVTDIDREHTSELAGFYTVTGFKVKGSDDDETVVLIGSKRVSYGYISIESPRIPLDRSSSYKWYNELKKAVDACRYQVALYKEGNFEPVEVIEEAPKYKDQKLPFGEGENELDQDFAEAQR